MCQEAHAHFLRENLFHPAQTFLVLSDRFPSLGHALKQSGKNFPVPQILSNTPLAVNGKYVPFAHFGKRAAQSGKKLTCGVRLNLTIAFI
jgi:hypothetical protein